MIPGASGEKKTIELTDFEIGALVKAIDICGGKCKCDLHDLMDSDDYYEFSSAYTKLAMVV